MFTLARSMLNRLIGWTSAWRYSSLMFMTPNTHAYVYLCVYAARMQPLRRRDGVCGGMLFFFLSISAAWLGLSPVAPPRS